MSTTNGIINLQTGIYLNVRQEPNFYADILGTLAPNTEITIIKQNGNWFEISYNGQNAYVFSEAIKTSETIPQGGISLNLNVPNNFEFGNTGEQPTFNWNALVTTSLIPIKNKSGEIQNGYFTSNGDHITIIKNNPETGLTFIQYPDQSANMYQQGWIDSSYISSKYLDFRFQQGWINTTENQKVYLFDNTISSTTLSKNTKYTLLYTISNYDIEYTSILFEENGETQLGFIPFTTGKLNFIVPNYPYNTLNEHSIKSLKPTVPTNAIVNSTVDLIDINGIKPYSYINSMGETVYPSIKAGSEISILQVFTSAEEQSILIEYYDEGSNNYKKGYLPINVLYNKTVSIDTNNVTWNNPSGTYNLMDLTDSNVIYELPASQTIQYLYTVGDFACILFNNNNLSGWPLQTGYVHSSSGKFINKNTLNSLFTPETSSITYLTTNYNATVNSPELDLTAIYIFCGLTPNELLTTTEVSNTSIDSLMIRDLNGSLISKVSIPASDVSYETYGYNPSNAFYFSLTLNKSILNILEINSQYKLSIAFNFNGISAELPLKYESTPSSFFPKSNCFKIILDSSSNIILELLPRYLFLASFDSYSYTGDSVSLFINTKNINTTEKIVFDKNLEKSLIIKDVDGNTITTISGKQVTELASNTKSINNQTEDTNYNGLSVTLTKNNLGLLIPNTQYNLFVGFEYKNKYIEIPVMFNSSNLRTNLCFIYPTDYKAALTQPNEWETSIKLLNTDFVANLKYQNASTSETTFYLVGNVIGDAIFTQTTQKNLVFKNTTTGTNDFIIPTIPKNWFSTNTNDYSSFEIVLGPSTFNQLNPNYSYDLFISFTLNNKVYEIPLCKYENFNSWSGMYNYFLIGLDPNSDQLNLSVAGYDPTTTTPIPSAPTTTSPWVGVVTSTTYPYSIKNNNNAPILTQGEILDNITGKNNDYYSVQIGKNTFYYPTKTITIIQK